MTGNSDAIPLGRITRKTYNWSKSISLTHLSQKCRLSGAFGTASTSRVPNLR